MNTEKNDSDHPRLHCLLPDINSKKVFHQCLSTHHDSQTTVQRLIMATSMTQCVIVYTCNVNDFNSDLSVAYIKYSLNPCVPAHYVSGLHKI